MKRKESRHKTRQVIVSFVRRLNRCWLEGRFDDLTSFLHPDIVMVQPGFEHRLVGRAKCIEGYRGFISSSKVLKYRESNHRVDSFGSVAIVSYSFDIKYNTGRKRYHDTGHDVFVLLRDRRGWRAIWRTLIL